MIFTILLIIACAAAVILAFIGLIKNSVYHTSVGLLVLSLALLLWFLLGATHIPAR